MSDLIDRQPSQKNDSNTLEALDCVRRQAAIEIIQSMYPGMPRIPWMRKDWQKRYEPYIRAENAIRKLPSAQPDKNMIHLQKEQAYMQGWEEGREALRKMLSAQPERLTDDDFETIRIHLNACKEQLCNQQRWKEAEEYQRIIDRFMAFASIQPEIIRCKDCKHRPKRLEEGEGEGFNIEFPDYKCPCQCDDGWYNWMPDDNWFCGDGERKDDE